MSWLARSNGGDRGETVHLLEERYDRIGLLLVAISFGGFVAFLMLGRAEDPSAGDEHADGVPQSAQRRR
jgi:hypothetical protein